MLRKIQLHELYPYIELAFQDDTDLPKYHISENDFANHTYQTIKEASEMLPLTYYSVDGIGFTVLIEPHSILYSFGINKNHRTKKVLIKWFSEIKNILCTFDSILWTKNKRAISHLIKQGMMIKYETNEYTILTSQ